MKVKRTRDSQPEVYSASLNDIMFFLLLFFLIVSTLVNPSVIQLMLPKASANIQKMSKQTINLSVTKDLKYFLNDRPLPFNEIKPTIKKLVPNVEDATVILRADKSIELQDLVNVLDIGHQLHLKMILATQK
ncbi:MAG: biopolymer transporter ExbD [Bacteroidota bacterium]|nr:biopolymer transporter ExbD [Bacteroidota bacterium]MDP4205260.1 biopolymer transporter ExbD [Bacteroidota bacterium]